MKAIRMITIEFSTHTEQKSQLTCAELGKHLHGVVEPPLAEQVEGVQVLDVVDLLALVSIRVVLHLLGHTHSGLDHDNTSSLVPLYTALWHGKPHYKAVSSCYGEARRRLDGGDIRRYHVLSAQMKRED